MLRLYVGVGRPLSWEDLAAATGDEVTTLRSYVRADNPPQIPLARALRIMKVLADAGIPQAANKVMRMTGMTVRPRQAAEIAQIHAALAKAARLVSVAADAVADNAITHIELIECVRAAAEALPHVSAVADMELHA